MLQQLGDTFAIIEQVNRAAGVVGMFTSTNGLADAYPAGPDIPLPFE